jgi:hypothetical protein
VPAFLPNSPRPTDGASVAPRAEADLDDIWLYVAGESGSIEIANRLIDTSRARWSLLPALKKAGYQPAAG